MIKLRFGGFRVGGGWWAVGGVKQSCFTMISPSGEQPEQRVLAHTLWQPTSGYITIFHKYCCSCKTWGYKNKFDEILGGILLVYQNTTIRIYGAWVKIWCVLGSKTFHKKYSPRKGPVMRQTFPHHDVNVLLFSSPVRNGQTDPGHDCPTATPAPPSGACGAVHCRNGGTAYALDETECICICGEPWTGPLCESKLRNIHWNGNVVFWRTFWHWKLSLRLFNYCPLFFTCKASIAEM